MIEGFFLPNGRPYVMALLVIDDLNVEGPVPFLVDTGAGSTVLHTADGVNLGLPLGQLGSLRSARGVGGSRQYYTQDYTIVLGTEDVVREFDITIGIAPPGDTRVTNDLPSLLGRNVLNRLRMEYDHRSRHLRFFD